MPNKEKRQLLEQKIHTAITEVLNPIHKTAASKSTKIIKNSAKDISKKFVKAIEKLENKKNKKPAAKVKKALPAIKKTATVKKRKR